MHLNKISGFPHDRLCLSLSWRSVCFMATAGSLALARCYATIDESQCASIKKPLTVTWSHIKNNDIEQFVQWKSYATIFSNNKSS